MSTSSRIDRERIRRTLTFWLRPAFLLRALTRFQRITGFDRAVALASGTLTALIPLAIVISSLLPNADAASTARKIIGRYSLTGAGADAVRSLFSPAGGDVTGISVVGALLLVIAMLSFSRSMQRLFEQTWELTPLSVRNTPNDLLWLAGLVAYIALSWGIHRLIDRGAVQIVSNALLVPASAVFLLWTGWVLSARRVERRSLAPFAIVGAIVLAVYLTGAAAYAPHLFSSYASRYGAVRGRLRDDLDAVRTDGGPRRLRRARPRGVRRAESHPPRRGSAGG